jgi:hypothetical protein
MALDSAATNAMATGLRTPSGTLCISTLAISGSADRDQAPILEPDPLIPPPGRILSNSRSTARLKRGLCRDRAC